MTIRKRVTTGLVSAAFIGGTLALAPAVQAAPAPVSVSAAAVNAAAEKCPWTTGVGFYCGYDKRSKYTDFGDNGRQVKEVQALIKYTAYYNGRLTIDGDFGPDTRKAVKYFQKKFMGDNTPDGIVGPQTWKALRLK
ncbi:peptidoglycan-binding domain-containing protein [Streptomyces sp. NPDC054855]